MAMKRNSRFRRFIRSIFRFPLPDNEEEAGKFTARNFLLKFHSSHIREEHLALKHTFCLGGISALLFFTACISGIVLMLYYHPDIASAHNSILDIENVVPWGSFWRSRFSYSHCVHPAATLPAKALLPAWAVSPRGWWLS